MPRPADPVDDLARQWLRHARADLALASILDDDRIAPEILAFHAQQAAEKALKAVLVARQVEFPRTHVIGLLIARCRDAGLTDVDSLLDAATLTRFAVESRYPGESEDLTSGEAEVAAGLARLVVHWAERALAEPD